ncbi:MAG: helix-turn-helix domain-containing protein [Cohaesibacter sp.]|nr:helix-turn-helix domain-containing protein [Cohaesibacter sp.]
MPSFHVIRSVERSFLILQIMNKKPVSTVTMLSEESGYAPATVVRILETLSQLGYVAQIDRRVGYVLTEKCMELSAGYHGVPVFVLEAAKLLEELTNQLLWPVALATLDDLYMVVRTSTIPQSPLSHTHSTVQKRLDLLTRAHGRCYLAYCSDIERTHLLNKLVDATFTQMSVEELSQWLDPILEKVRRLGYAERDHAIDPQTTTLAVPVMKGSNVIATIGLTFFRGVATDRLEIAEKLHLVAEKIAKL